MHDIGKLDIPVDVLSKPAPLDPDERYLMDTHPREGFDRLEGIADERVRRIIVGHHEYQRSAYPRKGPRLHNLSSLTELVAVADLFDALASKRSYKPALEKDVIERIMREDFLGDPSLVERALARY